MIGVSPWLSALLLATAMVSSFFVGWRFAKRWPRQGQPPASRLNEASIALLGLLLAFSFSLALAQHVQRRERVLDDSNAIGDFYTCVSLLDEPLRSRLQALVRRYVEHRASVMAARPDAETLAREVERSERMQHEMQELVRQAVAAHTPVVVPLVNKLNEVTSVHAARLAAASYRLPWTITALLCASAVLASLIAGMQEGSVGVLHLVPTLVFVILVALVVGVTLDLDESQRGAITVSQEPLQRLLRTMAP